MKGNRNAFEMRRQRPGYGDERQQLGDAAHARDLDPEETNAFREAAKARDEEELKNTEAEDGQSDGPDFGDNS